jgi:hypothetical protein
MAFGVLKAGGCGPMTFVGTAHPLNRDGLIAAAEHVGIHPTVLWSVVAVETSGSGFLPDRRPKILFERHIFSSRTGRRFDASHPDISGPAGGYGRSGAPQYQRLEKAIACDRAAALESASWGLGQVMGFNARLAGFRDVEDMVAQMVGSENEQLLAMARFMRGRGMHAALQRRDWTAFARSYNGPGFAANRYHEKLAAAHAELSSRGLPDLDARSTQLLLTYHGFDPSKIDGIFGERTQAAIIAFATKRRLTEIPSDPSSLHSAFRERLPPGGGRREHRAIFRRRKLHARAKPRRAGSAVVTISILHSRPRPAVTDGSDRLETNDQSRNKGFPVQLKDRLWRRMARECEAMAQYALSIGCAVPVQVMGRLDQAISAADEPATVAMPEGVPTRLRTWHCRTNTCSHCLADIRLSSSMGSSGARSIHLATFSASRWMAGPTTGSVPARRMS